MSAGRLPADSGVASGDSQKADGVDAFVFGDARQRLDDPRGVAGTNRIRDRLADGVARSGWRECPDRA